MIPILCLYEKLLQNSNKELLRAKPLDPSNSRGSSFSLNEKLEPRELFCSTSTCTAAPRLRDCKTAYVIVLAFVKREAVARRLDAYLVLKPSFEGEKPQV